MLVSCPIKGLWYARTHSGPADAGRTPNIGIRVEHWQYSTIRGIRYWSKKKSPRSAKVNSGAGSRTPFFAALVNQWKREMITGTPHRTFDGTWRVYCALCSLGAPTSTLANQLNKLGGCYESWQVSAMPNTLRRGCLRIDAIVAAKFLSTTVQRSQNGVDHL